LHDFDDVAFVEGRGVDFAGEEGLFVVLDDHGFAGETEEGQQIGDGVNGIERAGLAVNGESHGGAGRKRWASGGENGGIPVFPHGIQTELAEAVGDGGGAAFVGDPKLTFGTGLVRLFFQVDAFAADREVQIVGPGAGITAGFGVAARAHNGNTERGDGVAEGGGLACAHDDADFGKSEAECGQCLDQGVIGEAGEGLEAAGGGPEARERHGKGRLPAVFVEMLKVGGEPEGFEFPVAEAEEGADADAAEAAQVAAFGAGKAPVEVFFGAGSVHDGVDVAVIGFLINDEAFGAGGDHALIFRGFHRADLDADGGDEVADGANAGFEVAVTDEAWVLAGDEEDVAKPLGDQMSGFLDDLVDSQCGAEDGVVAGEAAVVAIIDALVGDVEGGEEAHGAAKIPAGEGAGFADHGFKLGGSFRFQQGSEAVHERGLSLRQRVEGGDELSLETGHC
jgi:hypothetical protein